MAKFKLTFLAAAVFCLMWAAPAWADYIDLTNLGGDDPTGSYSYVLNNALPGVNLTIDSTSGPGELYWSSSSGFGINNPCWLAFDEPDEVDQSEVLTLTFSEPVYLASIDVGLLFNEKADRLFLPDYYYNEVGFYSLNGGAWVQFQSNGDPLGNLTVGTGDALVNTITFMAAAGSWPENHDFTVKGLTARTEGEGGPEVPEPATMLLLGSAAGIGFIRRKFRK